MYKELGICIVIVISIFMLDSVTQNYTKNSSQSISEELEDIKNQIHEDTNKDEIQSKVEETYDSWSEFHDKLAIYIEHNELEKIETTFVACKSFIEQKDYNMAVNEIDKTIYALSHVKDKYAFSLINVF